MPFLLLLAWRLPSAPAPPMRARLGLMSIAVESVMMFVKVLFRFASGNDIHKNLPLSPIGRRAHRSTQNVAWWNRHLRTVSRRHLWWIWIRGRTAAAGFKQLAHGGQLRFCTSRAIDHRQHTLLRLFVHFTAVVSCSGALPLQSGREILAQPHGRVFVFPTSLPQPQAHLRCTLFHLHRLQGAPSDFVKRIRVPRLPGLQGNHQGRSQLVHIYACQSVWNLDTTLMREITK